MFQHGVLDRLEQLTISLIILNTVVMASDHNRMPKDQQEVNEYVNYFRHFVVR